MANPIPFYEADLFADDAIRNPYEHYRAMRELGPIVYLPGLDCYAATRFDAVSEVLRQPEQFISGEGISFNAPMNEAATNTVINSDGAKHDMLRKIELQPLSAKALNELRERVFSSARQLITDLLRLGPVWHDAVADIARHLPLTIVMELGGLPPQGKERMLKWAASVFDLQGPLNERAQAAFPSVQEMLRYVSEDIDPGAVHPGSWAERAFRMADDGEIPPDLVPALLTDFIAPSLDTTIAGTGNLLMLLAQNPDQWALLRSDRGKVPNAINEALRLESPIRCFTRYAPRETSVCGMPLPARSRVAVFYAAANRDERVFERPDSFDISRRNASQHLAFGLGAHQCIGNNLARLEMMAILNELLDEVEAFEIGEPVYALNNLLRTLHSMPIRFAAPSRTN